MADDEVKYGPSALQALSAVFLVAVPTYFQFLPEVSDSPLWARTAMFAGWAFVAIWLAFTTIDVASVLDKWLKDQRRKRTDRIALGFSLTLASVVQAASPLLPQGTGITIYLVDDTSKALVPVHPGWNSPGPDIRRFEKGCGATGMAVKTGDQFIVEGDEVHTAGLFGLTPAQAAYYAHFRTVVAEPMLGVDGEIVGVVTLVHPDEKRAEFRDTYRSHLVLLAQTVGTLTSVFPRDALGGSSEV